MKNLLLFTILATLLNSCVVEVQIDGCTDPYADNFNVNADYDDGSCEYWGCTDPLADNFDPQANVELINACQYSANLVYYLDYSASQYMLNWGISYYAFYDSYNNYIGYITNNYYWTSPPNCLPQGDGSTLTATLYWNGNYNNNRGTFSWQAYPDNGPIADYDYTEINVIPGECRKLQLSKKKIQEYKASK